MDGELGDLDIGELTQSMTDIRLGRNVDAVLATVEIRRRER